MSKQEESAPDVSLGGNTEGVDEDQAAALEFVGQQLKKHYPDTDAFARSIMKSISIHMSVLRGSFADSEVEKINRNLCEYANSTHMIEAKNIPPSGSQKPAIH